MAVLCLHIGMSKTATTWLQKNIFPPLYGRSFRDNPRSSLLQGGRLQGALARAFRRSPEVWPRMGSLLLKELSGEPEHGNATGRDDILVSDQSAGPRLFEWGDYIGSHWERERMDPSMLSAHLRAMRKVALADGFSALKVILIIRRQDQWLASKYAQRSDRIYGASQRDFEERIHYYLDEHEGYYSDGVILDYLTLWKALVEALGTQHVLMLPYEFLLVDPEGFLRRIVDFHAAQGDGVLLERLAASLPINVRSSAPDSWRLRSPQRRVLLRTLGNPRASFHLSWTSAMRKRRIILAPWTKKKILDTYRDSNCEVGQRIGHDLREFGYFE